MASSLSLQALRESARSWSRQTFALIGCGLCFMVFIPFETAITPWVRAFEVDDPRISYPTAQEIIPTWALGLLGIGFPVTILVVSMFSCRRYLRHNAVSLLGFATAVLATVTICDVLKNLIGEDRPDFLSRCRPHPDTPPGVPVGLEVCQSGLTRNLYNGCRSAPSGHSSFFFGALGFLTYWFVFTFELQKRGTPMWKRFLAVTPLFAAAGIAYSRIIEHKHHWIDVISGGLLGAGIAYGVYLGVVDTMPEPKHVELASESA